MRLRIPSQVPTQLWVPTQPARLLQLTTVSLGHLLPRSQVDELPHSCSAPEEEMIKRNFFQEVLPEDHFNTPARGRENTNIPLGGSKVQQEGVLSNSPSQYLLAG